MRVGMLKISNGVQLTGQEDEDQSADVGWRALLKLAQGNWEGLANLNTIEEDEMSQKGYTPEQIIVAFFL